jgi:hypothetical protein
MREPNDFVFHLVEREGVTVVDVGETLFVVRLLVAGGFGEVHGQVSELCGMGMGGVVPTGSSGKNSV